jgi:hypothetical protein
MAAYHGVPLDPSCPLIGEGCGLGGVCTYDLTTHKGTIDGRCLTKAAALAALTQENLVHGR